MEIIVFQGLLFFLYSVLLSWNAFIVRVGFAGHGQSLAIGPKTSVVKCGQFYSLL